MLNGKKKPIIIVQGAQWGSEAKGQVAAWLTQQRKVDYVVRTGAVNAGHTVMWDGTPQKMQQLPTGWIRPQAQLVLGPGAYIHPGILAREIEKVSALTGEDVRERLVIDYRAGLHLPSHTSEAQTSNRHHLIGATGKGCSVAITDKISKRGNGGMLFKDWMGGTFPRLDPTMAWLDNLVLTDTVDLLHNAYDSGKRVLLEGTQGTHLDLNTGPYPYTTHKPTSAAQWVVEAGLAPGMDYEVVAVARTYPIRVAGNSGPMPKETTWANIAREVNRRLMTKHLGQRVKSFALDEWERTLDGVANSGKYQLPKHNDGGPNFDFHKWTPEMRVEWRVALSEMPSYTLGVVSAATAAELDNLFEFTTVTRKLRRVAQWDPIAVEQAVRWNRAKWVFLTFFNYWFPELWGAEKIDWDRMEYRDAVRMVEQQVGATVKYVNTGPSLSEVVEADFPRD